MTDLQLLREGKTFQLQTEQSFVAQLKKDDQRVLKALRAEVGPLRGKELVRKIYLEYPQYVLRSRIARRILTSDELEHIHTHWNNEEQPCLFTLGYEGLAIDAYLNILITHNISALVDVRKNPISMKYGFSKSKLSEYLENAGISYIHIPDLGIPSHLRQNLSDMSAYQELFEYYKAHILPEEKKSLEFLKNIFHTHKRVALTCFEADATCCHRHKVTEYLAADSSFDVPIVHLRGGSEPVSTRKTTRRASAKS